jgi:hypothetical protein
VATYLDTVGRDQSVDLFTGSGRRNNPREATVGVNIQAMKQSERERERGGHLENAETGGKDSELTTVVLRRE